MTGITTTRIEWINIKVAIGSTASLCSRVLVYAIIGTAILRLMDSISADMRRPVSY